MRIAILEDDPSQGELLSYWLKLGGHQSCVFTLGQALLYGLAETKFDTLLLDWNIPDLSGIDVLRQVRRKSAIPVLFCTSKDQEEDVALALREGADDYCVKPMRRLEFLARLNAVSRRSSEMPLSSEWLELGDLRINCQNRTAMRGGAFVPLSCKQFDLAVLLLTNVGRSLARSEILKTVFPGVCPTSRTLDTHIASVKSKLGLVAEQGWCLSALYGQGYRLQRLTRLVTRKQAEYA